MIISAFAFIATFFLALVLVPVCSRWLAAPLGLLDQPDNNRKLHKTAIPLVGGVSIFFAASLTCIAVYFLGNTYFADQLVFKPGDASQFLGLLIGSAVLLTVGVVDDSVGLRGRQKLIGQVIAIGILIAFGFDFERMKLLDTTISFGDVSFIIVVVWCLAVTNSVNLLDGADGFAATIGIVMSVALGIMALFHPNGRMFDAVIVLALAGGLLGFLRYNFPPAKVFLGDAGSMLIGFVLAAISIRCALKQHTSYAFFAPLALLAIPFLDTTAAIIRRKLTGRSIYAVDRGHLHHSLMKRGFGPRLSLLWVGLLCATTAAGGTIAFVSQQPEYAIVSVVIVVLVMISGRLFGVAEVELVSNKAVAIGKSFVRGNKKRPDDRFNQSTVQLQGHRNWREIWDELCEFSDDHELNEIVFDINLPWLHESFHAKRRKTDVPQVENDEWYSQVPFIVDGKIFGRVELLASKGCRFSHHDILSNLMKLVADIEPRLKQKADTSVIESNGHASMVPVEQPVSDPATKETLETDSKESESESASTT